MQAMRCKETPCCPMISKLPQIWISEQLSTSRSGKPLNLIYDKNASRRPRSRCTRSTYRSRQSHSSSPKKRVTHVKSLSPSKEGILSPPLCNSPDRYRSSSTSRSLLLDLTLLADVRHGDAAYFSSRPPFEPIRLIFTSSNGHTIRNDVSAKDSLDTCSSSKNIYSTSNLSSKQPVTSISEKARPRKLRKMVRRLLQTFIQHLPLPDAEESSFHIVTASGSTTMIAESELEQRSISIQAFTSSRTVSVGNCNELCSAAENVLRNKKTRNRVWKGGLRALRDSHLRLLMRQLRHLRYIDRLDRSLKLS